jgi:hypothetical protein
LNDKLTVADVIDQQAPFPVPFDVSQYMKGMKKAVYVRGERIFFSPAMHDLVSHAEGDELAALLRAIPVTVLPAFDLDSLDIVPFSTEAR